MQHCQAPTHQLPSTSQSAGCKAAFHCCLEVALLLLCMRAAFSAARHVPSVHGHQRPSVPLLSLLAGFCCVLLCAACIEPVVCCACCCTPVWVLQGDHRPLLFEIPNYGGTVHLDSKYTGNNRHVSAAPVHTVLAPAYHTTSQLRCICLSCCARDYLHTTAVFARQLTVAGKHARLVHTLCCLAWSCSPQPRLMLNPFSPVAVAVAVQQGAA